MPESKAIRMIERIQRLVRCGPGLGEVCLHTCLDLNRLRSKDARFRFPPDLSDESNCLLQVHQHTSVSDLFGEKIPFVN